LSTFFQEFTAVIRYVIEVPELTFRSGTGKS